jgi:hypothetical protein
MRDFIAATLIVLAAWLTGQKAPTRLANWGGYAFWTGMLLLAGFACMFADSYLPVFKIAGCGYLIISGTAVAIYLIAAALKAYEVMYLDK